MSSRPLLDEFVKKVDTMNEIQQVYFINQVFGNSNADVPKERVIDQAKNIFDEVDELREAYNENDMIEVADAYGDLLTFAYGVGYFLRYENKMDDFDVPPTTSSLESIADKIVSETNRLIREIDLKRDVKQAYVSLIGTIHEIGIHTGINSNEVMREVTISNLSKLCFTNEEMLNTVDKYESIGVDVYVKYFKVDSQWVYVVYSSKEQVVKDKVYRKDKFLKSIYFEEPKLSHLV